MNDVEHLRQQIDAIVAGAPLTVFGACIVVALLWFAWYVVRGTDR